jgi:hypothetical protein
MHYSTRKGYINIILLAIILLALLVLVSWLSYQTGSNVAEGRLAHIAQPNVILEPVNIVLTTISLAQNAGLQNTTGVALIGKEEGKISIDVILEEGVQLPSGSVLQAWLVDAGNLGGLGEKSVSELDQQYGTPFANVDFTQKVDDAPYALSLGPLEWDSVRESYYIFYNNANNLIPYDAVMITLESDGNQANYDPRPGTPILIGSLE